MQPDEVLIKDSRQFYPFVNLLPLNDRLLIIAWTTYTYRGIFKHKVYAGQALEATRTAGIWPSRHKSRL